jgi:hypothetical protein
MRKERERLGLKWFANTFHSTAKGWHKRTMKPKKGGVRKMHFQALAINI